MPTLTIDLPDEIVEILREEVTTGPYGSDSRVIQEALRFWRDRILSDQMRLAEIREEIEAAVNDPVVITDEELGRYFDEKYAEALRKLEH